MSNYNSNMLESLEDLERISRLIKERNAEKRSQIDDAIEALQDVRDMPAELLERAPTEQLVQVIRTLIVCAEGLAGTLGYALDEQALILDGTSKLVDDLKPLAKLFLRKERK